MFWLQIHSHLKQKNTHQNEYEVKYEDYISNGDDVDTDDDINLRFQGVDDLEDANDQNPLSMVGDIYTCTCIMYMYMYMCVC